MKIRCTYHHRARLGFLAFAARPTLYSISTLRKGHVEPLPMALPDLAGKPEVGAEIMQVVSAGILERSGLFRPIAKDAFIEEITAQTSLPRFADWRQINATALVTGTAEANGNNIHVTFRLWDVPGEEQMVGKEYNTFENNWRRIAHIMADEIYQRLTGESGYFDSRIVYVAESGPDTHTASNASPSWIRTARTINS